MGCAKGTQTGLRGALAWAPRWARISHPPRLARLGAGGGDASRKIFCGSPPVWSAHHVTLSRPKLCGLNCGFFRCYLSPFFGGAAMPHISRIALVFAAVLSLFASAPQRAAAETSELMKAIQTNDVRWVRALIAAGANVKNDVRPLREAAIRGYVPIAKALIDGGAEVNGRGYPLNAAARAGQTEMVALLIQRGADVNARDLTPGYTPLHFAARFAQFPLTVAFDPRVKVLLTKAGAN